MASISVKTYVNMLLSSLEGVSSADSSAKAFASAGASDQINLLLSLVRKNKDEKKLHEISRVFEREFYRVKGIEKGFIQSASRLTEKDMKMIEKILEEKLKIKVELKNETDKSVIGGFKFFSEDHVLDASIGRKITELEKKLAS